MRAEARAKSAHAPLTVLVISDIDGTPGHGFIGAQHVPRAHARVFSFVWLASPPPNSDVLNEASRKLPSNGRSLEQLEQQSMNGRRDE